MTLQEKKIEVVSEESITAVSNDLSFDKNEDYLFETEEFKNNLKTELLTKTLWRKLESLSYSLNVDMEQLKKHLDKSNGVLRKIGKESVVFYCLESRLSEEKEKIIKKTKIEEEKNYSIAMLHMVYWNFYKVLKTYGLEISRIDQDAFNMLTQSLDKMESGIIIFSNKSDADIEKLPKFR